MSDFSFNMYRNQCPTLIDFDYSGAVVNFVLLKNKDINLHDKINRFLLTTLEERDDKYLMTLYYQGKRVFGKRFDKNKTITIESHRLIVSYSFDIMEREYERAKSNKSKNSRAV